MKSTEWITSHDLSLVIDNTGRLWRFRPNAVAHRDQPVEANVQGGDIVVTVAVPGVKPGDMDVQVERDVLELRGTGVGAQGLWYTVGLPRRVQMHEIETAYTAEGFDVRVPLAPVTVVETALEETAVAV